MSDRSVRHEFAEYVGCGCRLVDKPCAATCLNMVDREVSDNGRMRLEVKFCLIALFVLTLVAPLRMAATDWYVRADGGSRFSSKTGKGQCDGKGDAAYPGRGVNQHCAFGDYRYLYDDRQSYGVLAWVISSGDTVIIDNAKPWRVGFDQGVSANDAWCDGGPGPYGCTNPRIPPGTAAQHTRILGRHYKDCQANGAKSELFGGFGLGVVFNLAGAQYVDVECLEITRHSQCMVHGSPTYPTGCHTNFPLDDYDSEGVMTDGGTHDLLLQDVWIHGHTDRGIQGPIGGLVIAKRVTISYNGSAGWDFDDGRSTPSNNGLWYLEDSVIEWNGCNQEYPARHEHPAIACYDQQSGGYGDGVGTPAHTGFEVHIKHSVFRFNTQDGLDLGHIDTGAKLLSIENSIAYGNEGGQFKWGGNFSQVLFQNNVAIANCMRMSQPISGTPSTFNANLHDFCRANDAISLNLREGGKTTMRHNTIITYAPTTVDVGCWSDSCLNSTLVFSDNVIRGYDDPGTYNRGGQHGGPGGFYYEKPIGHLAFSNNIIFGTRNGCSTSNAQHQCVDPKFANEPTAFHQESDLDNYNFHLTPSDHPITVGVDPQMIPAY